MICRALVYQSQQEPVRAQEAYETALTIGEPQGYLQTFLDFGNEQQRLLENAFRRGVQRAYVQRLLTALDGEQYLKGGHGAAQPPGSTLRDPLSEREMAVLQLMSEGLSNKQIAQRLSIALRTVKYHTTSIYTKLDVESRIQAVTRARELGLLY